MLKNWQKLKNRDRNINKIVIKNKAKVRYI